MVVTYMNTVGINAYVGLRRADTSHTVTTSSDSDAINWFAAPNNCQMYTHVPVITSRNVAAMLISVPTWMLRKSGLRSPSPSASVTRIILNTSCTTVMTITTNAAKPMAVPYSTGMPKTFRKLPTPWANMVVGAAGCAATDTASSE